MLPRGDPASLLVLGRPQQGPSQVWELSFVEQVEGRQVNKSFSRQVYGLHDPESTM